MVNRVEMLNQLRKYPVFGVTTVSRIINKSREYSWLVIYRLKKSNLIYELERDKYTTNSDPLVVASHVVWPCYISSWAAIRYHNLTEQLPSHIQVVISRPKKRREIVFKNATIGFIRIKRDNFFGFGKVMYGDFEIFMAEKEKAIADALYLKQMSFETFAEILREHKKEIDVKKLKSYLKKMGMKNAVGALKEVGV